MFFLKKYIFQVNSEDHLTFYIGLIQIHQLHNTNTPITKYSVFAVYYANIKRCRVFFVDFFQTEHVLPYSKEYFLKLCFQYRGLI